LQLRAHGDPIAAKRLALLRGTTTNAVRANSVGPELPSAQFVMKN